VGIVLFCVEVWYSDSETAPTTSWQRHHVSPMQALTKAVLPCSLPAALPEPAEILGGVSSHWWVLLRNHLQAVFLVLLPWPALLGREERSMSSPPA